MLCTYYSTAQSHHIDVWVTVANQNPQQLAVHLTWSWLLSNKNNAVVAELGVIATGVSYLDTNLDIGGFHYLIRDVSLDAGHWHIILTAAWKCMVTFIITIYGNSSLIPLRLHMLQWKDNWQKFTFIFNPSAPCHIACGNMKHLEWKDRTRPLYTVYKPTHDI